jgi:hypothetical protein
MCGTVEVSVDAGNDGKNTSAAVAAVPGVLSALASYRLPVDSVGAGLEGGPVRFGNTNGGGCVGGWVG